VGKRGRERARKRKEERKRSAAAFFFSRVFCVFPFEFFYKTNMAERSSSTLRFEIMVVFPLFRAGGARRGSVCVKREKKRRTQERKKT
jgi:hypothetical protein